MAQEVDGWRLRLDRGAAGVLDLRDDKEGKNAYLEKKYSSIWLAAGLMPTSCLLEKADHALVKGPTGGVLFRADVRLQKTGY